MSATEVPAPFEFPVYVTRPLRPGRAAFDDRVGHIWSTACFSNGGDLQVELEGKLREYLEVPYLSLWNNGTTALLGACRALELSGEVITTPFTFPATVHVLTWLGLQPVFADIDPDSLCLSPGTVEQAITPRTSAILAVHVYGTPCDVEGLADVAGRHGVRLIFDAAHAFGAIVGETGIGNFGDVSMFSFHATKQFHTGEGGALVTRDACLARRFELMRNFGIAGEEEMPLTGINGKLSELQAAVGLSVLPLLEQEQSARRALADRYGEMLRNLPGIRLLHSPYRGGIHQYLVVMIDRKLLGVSRDTVYTRLRTLNVYARRYFYPPVSDLPPYHTLPSAAPEQLPVARRAAEECLALPLFGELPADHVDRICAMLWWISETGEL